MPRVDVLVVTALVEEFEAARDVAAEGSAGDPGVATWEPRDEANPPPYLMGDYRLAGGGSLRTALARPTFMGGTETGAVAGPLVSAFSPGSLPCAASAPGTRPRS
jgi:hypothetical protein